MMIKRLIRCETYIVIGLLMVASTTAKLLFEAKIDSDWFWFIAGIALLFEGLMNLKNKQH